MRAVLSILAATVLGGSVSAQVIPPAGTVRICSDDFSSNPSNTWFYSGTTNNAGQNLFRYDATRQNIAAEWDQSNHIDGTSDPYEVVPSRLARPLGMTLTDADTFRVSATLNIATGTVPDTTEFYQVANIGLYDTNSMGADRAMADNSSGNTALVDDGSDFVEFNYFINNKSFGWNPNITATIGAHVTNGIGDYTTGSSADGYFHSTDMGADHWLPGDTNLYVDLVYFGAARNGDARRAHVAVYTDPQRATLLSVNGVSMHYWSQPLPADKAFSVSAVAFYNYVNTSWGGANGAGAGTWDDVHVDVYPYPYAPDTILAENFDGAVANGWLYSGVVDGGGDPLFEHDGVHSNVSAAWDQSNAFDGSGDPYVFSPSRYCAPLEHPLTEKDSFRIGATLNIETGTVLDTTEFYQIANVGLYNTNTMGPDRAMSDNWSGNTTLIKDGCDFVEFNYFINNKSFGFNPNITATIGANIAGLSGDYTTGSAGDTWFFHRTDMGADNWLPGGSNLYLEVCYLGASTNGLARRACAAIYTDPERRHLLYVNDVPMFYWTQPLPAGKTFRVTHAGFYNYVASSWGGANGEGAGTWDDVYVETLPCTISHAHENGSGFVVEWTSVPGRMYHVLTRTNLVGGIWTTNATVQATGYSTRNTNTTENGSAFYKIVY